MTSAANYVIHGLFLTQQTNSEGYFHVFELKLRANIPMLIFALYLVHAVQIEIETSCRHGPILGQQNQES